MKVKVRVKSSDIQVQYYEQVIAEAYAENEQLFQTNRDLERKIVILERDAKDAEERYKRIAKACDHWNSMAVEKTVELDEKCAAFADAMRTVRQRDALINELNDQIAASEAELAHANEVIMSMNEKLERLESENVSLLDHIDSLEADNADLTAECVDLRARAANYFEKWNALKQRNAQADNFAKAIITAIEKASANDTACKLPGNSLDF